MITGSLIGGLARGFSGFGGAMIFIPMASAAVGPQVAVPLLLVADGAMTLGLIPPAYRMADRREVLTMTAGALIGVPAGIWLLTSLAPQTIRWSIVVVVVALLALLVSGWRYHGRPKPGLTVLVGAISGLFSGAAQIGGPPVVAYWLGGPIPPRTVRANVVFYFALSSAISALGYLSSGLFTLPILAAAVAVAPLYGLGVWFGSRMFGMASERTFRRITYALIAGAALVSLPALDGVLRGG